MTLLAEIRYALRQFKLAPMFTATVVLTLALGIGACTPSIFSLIDAVMLKSLPVADPSRLYQIGIGKPSCVLNGMQGDWDFYSYKLYKQLASDAQPEFDQVAATGTVLARSSQIVEKSLRHNAIQPALYKYLKSVYGDKVSGEQPTANGTYIDVDVRQGDEYTCYEIKTGLSAQSCIRD